MKRAIKLLTIFNIPIEINYTWFITLGLVIFTLARGYFPVTDPGLEPAAHWLMAAIAALLLFASLLAHELAHSLVAVRNNLPIHGITLFVFGGVAHLGEEPSSPTVELKMAAAGPLLSFALAAFFLALTQTLFRLHCPDFLVSITNYLFIINLVVGMFNLIPGFPLDGGRILRAVIWKISGDQRRATGIASAFGKGFALCLMAAGFLYLFSGAVISGVWFIFIGLFLMEAADSSYRQVAMKKLLSGVRVGSIMTKNVVTVPAGLKLDELVENYFFRFRFASFPVVEDDHLLGLVTFHSVKEIDRERWPALAAQEVMMPISARLLIDQKAEVTEALTRMAGSGSGRLLVIDDGKLIGLLSQRDIMRLFEFKTEVAGGTP
jgi:Zn-dependent protease